VKRDKPHRTWTAVITVEGYNPMSATWSERDQHDDQIMHAAHEALRLMRASGAAVGLIDLFQDSPETGIQHVEQRTVTVDERGIVVSQNLTAW
jgi:hypothetical protein